MKEPMTLGQRMRFVTGGTYVVLALYQMLCGFYVIQSVMSGELYFSWKLSLYAIGLFAGMAVWMFSSRRALAGGARRAIAVGTLLVVCYELITYRAQTALISTALYTLLPNLYENTLAHFLFLLARLLLLILAAFFAAVSRGGPAGAEEPYLLQVEEDTLVVETFEEPVVMRVEHEDDDTPDETEQSDDSAEGETDTDD